MIQGLSSELEEGQMDTEATYQNFEELFKEVIRMFDEMDQQVNHVSFLIQEMTNDHIDNRSINSS